MCVCVCVCVCVGTRTSVHVVLCTVCSLFQYGVALWLLSFVTNCMTILTALFIGKSRRESVCERGGSECVCVCGFHRIIRSMCMSLCPADVALLFTVPVLYEKFQVGFCSL